MAPDITKKGPDVAETPILNFMFNRAIRVFLNSSKFVDNFDILIKGIQIRSFSPMLQILSSLQRSLFGISTIGFFNFFKQTSHFVEIDMFF